MKRRKQAGGILGAAGFLLLLASLIFYRESVGEGIRRSLSYSASVLIPSILPFLFVSELFSLRPSCRVLCSLFSPVGRLFFRLSPGAAPAVLFGLTCGYPVGARLTAGLLERGEITEEEASRLLLFAVNPGIPFCVLFLGGAVLGDVGLGFLLYLSVTAAELLAGVLLGLLVPRRNRKNSSPAREREIRPLLQDVKAASDSAVRACLTMTIYIVLFWGWMALLHESGLFGLLVRALPLPFLEPVSRAGLFSFFFEVTGGVSDSTRLGLPLSLFPAGLAFGGVCIHLQLFAFFPADFPVRYGRFLLARVSESIGAWGIFCLLCRLFPGISAASVPASAFASAPVFGGIRGNLIGSVSLLLLFLLYIILSKKETVEIPRER